MRRWAIIFTSVAWAGCVHYQTKPLDAAKRAEDFQARRLDDEGLRAFIEGNSGGTLKTWPQPRWNLELLTLAAYYFHPSLDVARAQWRVAEAAAISAGARPNPTVSLAPGFTANSPASVSPWLMAAGFDWPVETAGKRSLRVTQAKQLACAARFNLITAAWQARANVRDSLAAYGFADEISALLNEKVVVQTQIVAKLETRLQAGAITVTELVPARVTLVKLEAELAAARESKTSAEAKLAEAVGVSLSAITNAPDGTALYMPQLTDAQIADAKQHALLQRADLLATLAEYDAAETALRLEIAKQYPDLHFNPNYEYDQGANKWRLGLSLELPILNRNQGPIAEARANRDAAAAKFTALQAKIISDVDAAAQAIQLAFRRRYNFVCKLNVELSQEEAIKEQVRAGAADTLDLLASRLERLNNRMLAAEAGYRFDLAFGQFEDATQQVLAVAPRVIAAPPPEHLEVNPRDAESPESRPQVVPVPTKAQTPNATRNKE